MPPLSDVLERDLGALLSDLPQRLRLTRRGSPVLDVEAALADAGGGAAWDGAAGLAPDDSLLAVVRASDLPWTPRPGDGAEADGRRYRVASVRRVPGDAALTLTLEVP